VQLADAPTFEPGGVYNRVRHIHDIYGGQRQGGISTPLETAGLRGRNAKPGERGEVHTPEWNYAIFFRKRESTQVQFAVGF